MQIIDPSKIISTIALLLFFSNSSSDGRSPIDVVTMLNADLVKILQDKELAVEDKWQSLSSIITPVFDLKSMSQSILDRDWKEASKEEKKNVMSYFSQYLEFIYRENMNNFNPNKLSYIGEQIKKNRAIVDAVMKINGQRIMISYRLLRKEQAWRLYNVYFEDVSIVDNWKQLHTAMINSEGLQGLLTTLELEFLSTKKYQPLDR